MANIKSAVKRIRIAKRNEDRNKASKSNIKTILKKALGLISSKGADAEKLVRQAIKNIDKAVSKGILHKNTASRKKSRLMKKLNKSKAS
ncbi:MAG: 30S ribosomal protein S20 [Candidatus Margulisiibacteriota bacterium]